MTWSGDPLDAPVSVTKLKPVDLKDIWRDHALERDETQREGWLVVYLDYDEEADSSTPWYSGFCGGVKYESESTQDDFDAVSPAHYQGFSNGAEVIDISENLSSNGGQAVQYIARATRLDGRNKGNPVEDLRKAAFFCNREADRLEAAALKPT